MRQKTKIVGMTTRLHDAAVALGSLLVLLTALCSGQERSTPEPVAEVKGIVADAAGALIPQSEVVFKGESGTIVAHTSMDGSVTVELRTGRYAVTIAKPGFVRAKLVDFRIDAPTPTAFRVVLQVDRTPTDGGEFHGVAPTTTSDLPYLLERQGPPPPSSGGDLGLVTLPDSPRGYPPSVYMQFFRACSADKPCSRKDEFRADLSPKGCCVLTVTNGDGSSANEVTSYQVFLNGKRVLPTRAGDAQVAVKLRQNNALKVVLLGEPSSKVFILIAYDPRQPK
jgi:hypothetical protein